MGFSLNAWVSNSNVPVPSGSFTMLGNTGASNVFTPESQFQVTARIAGTFSLLQASADNVGTGRSVKFRKNGADGNQVVNPTDTTAGVYTDNTNSDTIAAGDTVDFSFTSTGTPSYNYVRTLFKASSNHACYYMAGIGGGVTPTASTTFYARAYGRATAFAAGTTTEANAKTRARVSGTLQNSQVVILTNARTTNCTVKSRIDTGGGSADGTVLITVTASTTGLFEDSSHTDTVSAGNDWNFSFTTGSGAGTLNVNRIGCAMGGIATASNDIFGAASAGTTRAASGTANFTSITGRMIGTITNESQAKIQHGFPATTSRLRMYLSANTYTTDGTVVLRKNGADATQTFALTASTTGLFEDSSHTDNFATTDDANISVIGGTSGSITMEWLGLTELDTTAGSSVFPYTQAFIL